jgi:hypothetical protein
MRKLLLLVLMLAGKVTFSCDVGGYGIYPLGDKILKYYDFQSGRGYEPCISVFNFENGKSVGVCLAEYNLTAGIISFEFAENNNGIYIKDVMGTKLVPFVE